LADHPPSAARFSPTDSSGRKARGGGFRLHPIGALTHIVRVALLGLYCEPGPGSPSGNQLVPNRRTSSLWTDRPSPGHRPDIAGDDRDRVGLAAGQDAPDIGRERERLLPYPSSHSVPAPPLRRFGGTPP
jgi:hypothetical protein